ncbi:hypothetical protein AQZ52_11140 [Novosphingobium fuchskuhlense]|uniref:DUF1643 domain-containing protein n=1 Tax=Novosphingobium fuchskuhlense TaxID=1117702 RepID=A0A117UUR2_9SPHN|nr:DUF1643 domain-containing protein [Novosphingobium fuchskuhlense]KUR71217.1 hypothetical protein AQZ52_11140 [Novosphingobium fuchskuhlense]
MSAAPTYLAAGADISSCERYRYRLWREWRNHPAPAMWDMWTDDLGLPVVDGAGEQLGEPLACVFVMLNPSTADGHTDDPTVRRCVGFAQRLGFDRLEVVNLFAYRATDPHELLALGHQDDPVGVRNQRAVAKALDSAGMIICAWGAHGGHLGQDQTILGWIDTSNQRGAPVMALGLTKNGHPRHPLYLAADSQPIAFEGLPA